MLWTHLKKATQKSRLASVLHRTDATTAMERVAEQMNMVNKQAPQGCNDTCYHIICSILLIDDTLTMLTPWRPSLDEDDDDLTTMIITMIFCLFLLLSFDILSFHFRS